MYFMDFHGNLFSVLSVSQHFASGLSWNAKPLGRSSTSYAQPYPLTTELRTGEAFTSYEVRQRFMAARTGQDEQCQLDAVRCRWASVATV